MFRARFVLVAVCVAFALSAPNAQQPQTPGQIRPRPAEGRQPEFPPPNIREYKPKSTLVTPQHLVPRAKFPVIDIHSHQPTPMPPDQFQKVVAAMDELNLKLLINLSGSFGDRLHQGVEAIRNSKYKDRMVLFANIDFRNPVGPGFGVKAARQLEDDVKAGAVGLKVDDPELDPVWDACARLNIPVLIHVAEPPAFFEPLDYTNERWLELALYPDRRHQTGVRFEELMTERNNMVKKHPNTRYILAHFGWHASDLARAGKLLDENPNVYYDVAAVL